MIDENEDVWDEDYDGVFVFTSHEALREYLEMSEIVQWNDAAEYMGRPSHPDHVAFMDWVIALQCADFE